MRKMVSVAVLAALLGFLALGGVIAQEDDPGAKIIPVEIYACTYNEGQGPDDLDDVLEDWNAFMDDRDVDSYAGWTLMPYYFTEEQDFDLIWLGAWTDGNAMGAGTDMWLSEGGDEMADIAEVVTCATHINLASVNLKMPPGGETPTSAVLNYSNCNMKDGVGYDDVASATRDWAEILTQAGSEAGIFHQFPIYGGGGDSPDFLWMNSYPNHTALGADYERMSNGGMWRQYQDLLGDLVECDVSRVYNAQNRRFVQLR